MRKPIIAGNWKMNMTPAEAERLVAELIPLVKDAACEVVVCPPYVDLALVGKLLVGTAFVLPVLPFDRSAQAGYADARVPQSPYVYFSRPKAR